MQAFLEYVVKGLVDRPDAVSVAAQDRAGTMLYELRVHPTDAGKVIGKQGATIHAIRALLQAGAAKKGIRCAMELVEERSEG
jgi:predicted RNA-binding protein YlqC (UPF0109 family)